MITPIIERFPVFIPADFVPTDLDADGVDLGPSGKPCAGYRAPYKPVWGGGFTAPRGPRRLAHRAIDIMAAEGSHVVLPTACADLRLEHTPKGGYCAYATTADGWIWYFAHMTRFAATLTATSNLPAGTLIGYVGRTGNAVRKTKAGLRGCPHLHLSLTRPKRSRGPYYTPEGEKLAVNGDKVDPVPVLKPIYERGGWR